MQSFPNVELQNKRGVSLFHRLLRKNSSLLKGKEKFAEALAEITKAEAKATTLDELAAAGRLSVDLAETVTELIRMENTCMLMIWEGTFNVLPELITELYTTI